jgi:hypothetical protein
MSISDSIKNGQLSSSTLYPVSSNAPQSSRPIYSKYATESSVFYEQYAQFGTNVFDAQIQGIDYSNFYNWKDVKIRASDVINPTTGDHLTTSWQKILIIDRNIDFIPTGAYVKFDDAVWIVYNPFNVASTTGTAIVVRANCTYNQFDYYGNVIQTPMVFLKNLTLATAPTITDTTVIGDAYQHIILQLNSDTQSFNNNTRIILGKSAYFISGLVDFVQEFTGNTDSVHLIRGDARWTEPTANDDMTNGIADGNSFSFSISISGNEQQDVGHTQTLNVTATRNGEVVTSTTNNPISYTYSSSDSSVATVDTNGIVTGVSQGTCNLIAVLKQNTSVSATFTVQVQQAVTEDYVTFTTTVPQSITQFDSATINAAYFVNGVQASDAITYAFSGASSSSYTATQSGNSLTIECWNSDNPLIVTASCNGKSASTTIQLVGY